MFYPKMFSYFPISVQCWPSNFWWRIISLILLIPSYTTPQNYLYLRIICMLFNLYQNLFDLLLTGSIQHFTFKLHLLLVSCSFVLAQLQMKRACFIWYFLHMSNFHKNCGNCFAYSAAKCFCLPWKVDPHDYQQPNSHYPSYQQSIELKHIQQL